LILKLVARDRSSLVTSAKGFIHSYALEPPNEGNNLSNEDRRTYQEARRDLIYDPTQPWTYFLHTCGYSTNTTRAAGQAVLLMFQNEVVKETHISHWYMNSKSPLCNEAMRAELGTTEAYMFSQSAVGVSD
jgi:hypothetical protein